MYVGHFALADLDALGVTEFEAYFKMLETQVKEENAAKKAAAARQRAEAARLRWRRK